MITESLFKAVNRETLTVTEAESAMDAIISGRTTDAQIGAFIAAMMTKGTTSGEIAAFASAMMRASVQVRPEVSGMLVDTCGTGGDGLNTFNISTASAIVTAGAGIPVVKHGNRSVSSRCGSADVLEELGVNIDAAPDAVKLSIEENGIGFLYAKNHHPAMRYAGRAREEIGIRSFFNILGPVSNPASADARLLGIYDPELTETIADVLRIMGVRNAMVVHGCGLDEITTTGETKISMFRGRGETETFYLTPEEFGIQRAELSDISGGDAGRNAEIIRDILNGRRSACRDIVLMNSAAAIYISGNAGSIHDGIGMAEMSIDSGNAAEKLSRLIKATGGEELL
ncbi:anthranilate phosphoribosyltransferase [Methanoplanus endosymbiosus]|uniref:Anthranilate phosphoribosyltransferase n=1 Tax=Methanoplanus endosymbiosus TaxID=33865 RepID=A0A9E7TIJ1_9EURY|nr:anthranilate phosphoribosyltransferase [Methanoplanus endosymbiosus]UUX92578.1 anthranilate phosphoribosyltransferase [Methanoplanus endosymbiosus]